MLMEALARLRSHQDAADIKFMATRDRPEELLTVIHQESDVQLY